MASDFCKQAEVKLRAERKTAKLDRYGQVMAGAVQDALLNFCSQDEEFAQAVVQGGSFEDCMKAVAKCVKGNALSDTEAYGAAVKFYFPGAEIRVTMKIDLLASVRDEAEEPEEDAGLLIDLSDFF